MTLLVIGAWLVFGLAFAVCFSAYDQRQPSENRMAHDVIESGVMSAICVITAPVLAIATVTFGMFWLLGQGIPRLTAPRRPRAEEVQQRIKELEAELAEMDIEGER